MGVIYGVLRGRLDRWKDEDVAPGSNGLLVGLTVSKVEGVVSVFNPGSDDNFVVASLSVAF